MRMVTFKIPDADEILGEYRVDRIIESVTMALNANLNFSYDAAISGAMRWPVNFRPEVVVVTLVFVN